MTAREAAEKVIVNAEQFRAQIQPPKGKTNELNSELSRLLHNHMDDDNESFYVTCHIDGNLKWKIQKGEFIDLE